MRLRQWSVVGVLKEDPSPACAEQSLIIKGQRGEVW